MTHDIAVIGAGPAGPAAAGTAAADGRDVVLLDAAPRPGGQYYRHRADEAGEAEISGDLGDLRARLGAVAYLPGHRVWHVESGFVVHALAGDRDERPVEIRARTLIMAAGAYDRTLPFPGWDLPGVLTAGAAQALVKGSGVTAGARIVVAGTGPFLLPVATGLAAAGSTVAGVFEAGRPYGFAATLARHPGRLAEGAGYAAALARARIPYRMGRAVVAAHGDDAVAAVSVARLDGDWRPVTGTEWTIKCDAVAIGYGFTPQLELPLQLGCDTRPAADGTLVVAVDAAQRTSVPGVYAAGEITGIGGAQLALVEGEIAGHAAAAGGRDVSGDRIRPLRAGRRRRRAFAAAMLAAYPARPGWTTWLRAGTPVCRCEEVSYSGLAAAIGLGATDPRTVKLFSRAGMGWCQGRVCGYTVAALTAAVTGGREPRTAGPHGLAHRPIAQPIRLGDLAKEAHREEHPNP
jgi:thioredoxin reductase